jgi:competence protein ComEC
VPWLAIAYGCGIAVYFTVDREPAPWATILLLAAAVAATILCRRRPVVFPLALGAAVMAAGLTTATVKRAIIAHPVLSALAWNVDVAGVVEMREERERSDRVVVRVDRIDGAQLHEKLERVRVAVRKGTAPAVGTFVEFKARLSPRWSLSGPAAMTSRVTCISSASVHPASCSAVSAAQTRRTRPR